MTQAAAPSNMAAAAPAAASSSAQGQPVVVQMYNAPSRASGLKSYYMLIFLVRFLLYEDNNNEVPYLTKKQTSTPLSPKPRFDNQDCAKSASVPGKP